MIRQAEDALVAQCLGGDQDAFGELVATHHDRVYRLAYSLTGDASDAAEVEQEAFLKAWRGLRSFRGEASLSTWLTRLAINAGHDYLRRKRPRLLLELPLLHPSRFVRRADDKFERVEQHDALDRALRDLAAPIRQTIALPYGADLSVREIAEVLGCPEGTVKWRLSTGIQRLRQRLDRDEAIDVRTQRSPTPSNP